MDISIDDIDIYQLRQDLINYFGSAAFVVTPLAFMDVSNVETASDVEVIKIALDNGFDITDYIKRKIR